MNHEQCLNLHFYFPKLCEKEHKLLYNKFAFLKDLRMK